MLEPNGDIIDPGRERRGCHQEELDDLYDRGMPFAVYDREGRFVIGGSCDSAHYHAALLALRDLLDQVDPSREDELVSARAE